MEISLLGLNKMNAILGTKEWAIQMCCNLKIKMLTPHDDCLPACNISLLMYTVAVIY
jgi:hypothetical protein